MSEIRNNLFEKINHRSIFGDGGYLTIFRIAFPLVIMSATHAIMQFADRKFLANHSSLDLAASVPAGTLYFTLYCFFMVTVNFSSAIIAQLHGAGEKKELVSATWSAFVFAIISALFIIHGVPFLGKTIIHSFGHSPELVALEMEYFNAILFSGVFTSFSAAFLCFFNGRGITKYAAIASFISCALNIFLDYAMIFGNFGFPAMGIRGAGLATTISSAAPLLLVFVIFIFQDQRKYPTREFSFHWKYIGKLLSFGTPSGLQTFLDVSAYSLLTFALGYLGPEILAGVVLALTVNGLVFVPMMGLADTASILTGQFIGKGRKNQVQRIVFRVFKLALVYGLFCGLSYWIFPEILIGFFRPNEANDAANFAQVSEAAKTTFRFLMIMNAADVFKYIFMGALRGAGDTKAVLLIAGACGWGLLIPMTLLLTLRLKAPVSILWSGLIAVYLIESALMFWRFNSGKWKKIKLIDHSASIVPVDELTDQKL